MQGAVSTLKFDLVTVQTEIYRLMTLYANGLDKAQIDVLGRGVVSKIRKIQRQAREMGEQQGFEPSERTSLEAISSDLVSYLGSVEKAVEAISSGLPIANLYMVGIEHNFQRLHEEIDTLLERTSNYNLTSVLRTAEGHKAIVIAVLTTTAVLSLIIGAMAFARIARAVVEITAAMTEIAADQADVPLPASNRTDEIGQMARTLTVFRDNAAKLQAANLELERSNAELQELLYATSHDLNEPLNLITGYANLLAARYRGRLDTDGDDYLGYIVSGTDRLKALVRDILTYSRIAEGLALTDTALSPLLGEVLTRVRDQIEAAGASISADALPVVMADRHQIGHVLENLIANALRFCRDAPKVHIGAEPDPCGWKIFVRDNGIGIDPRDHKKIFEVFRRIHPEMAPMGTGVGLAICKRIVERHGGTMGVNSQPGAGSTFWFTLPSGNDHAPA